MTESGRVESNQIESDRNISDTTVYHNFIIVEYS